MTDKGAASHGRPLCPCHDEPMTRRNDVPSGWRCSVRHAKANQAYRAPRARAMDYARTRARLRARIAHKRARIEELEALLHEAQDQGRNATAQDR